MLASVDVRLSPRCDVRLPFPCANKVHAAILTKVKGFDPTLSASMHEEAQVKPFSFSTLFPEAGVNGDSLRLEAGEPCRIRITTLNSEVFEAIRNVISALSFDGETLPVGQGDFDVSEVIMTPPLGGVSDWETLAAGRNSTAVLQFISPTAFRRRGLNVPLPDPQMVYGSLWQKWQAFSSVCFDESVYNEMLELLALSEASIQTLAWNYKYQGRKDTVMKGFVGSATFELTGHPSDEALALFNGLSRLAFFAGVGYKTTMGMGQCLYISDDQLHQQDLLEDDW